jgi:predicted O-linked N-acetylglucosamine transferase (SPINDLY family)
MSGTVGPDPRELARQAVRQEPGNAMAWTELSDVELDAGDTRAGMEAARRALQLAPGHPEPLARLGRAHSMLGQHRQAADHLRAAAQRAPDHPGIAVWLAHALEDIGEAEEASLTYAKAHAAFPHPQVAAHLLAWRRRLCDWRGIDHLVRVVRDSVAAGHGVVEPFAFLSEDVGEAEQLACARARADAVASRTGMLPPRTPKHCGSPIRMGFLSNGFGAHPTGSLTVALFEALSIRTEAQVHLFALNRDDGSAIRHRLQQAASALHDVSVDSNAAIARRIRDVGIDILFDLRGWGGGGRPEVLAMRPAPIQVNWLAYPGTSGAPWIDYILADRVALPTSSGPYFSEAVAWLPRCFQPSDTRRVVPPAPARKACGLPENAVVYCCFNNSYKINPASFDRMLAVLREVPRGVLWLLSGPGRADARLRAAAASAGIEPSRLVFMDKQPQPAYLARLGLADLFLDCNPYNAHTTASDAIWAGCPVITRPGTTFASRVAASLNYHLGLERLNVPDDQAFVSLAVSLGRDPLALSELQHEVARKRDTSTLFDMVGFASDLIGAASRMVDRNRSGLAPASFP